MVVVYVQQLLQAALFWAAMYSVVQAMFNFLSEASGHFRYENELWGGRVMKYELDQHSV